LSQRRDVARLLELARAPEESGGGARNSCESTENWRET
jgi:hypothetical protein